MTARLPRLARLLLAAAASLGSSAAPGLSSDAEVRELLAAASTEGFIGALADWTAKKGIRLTDAVLSNLGRREQNILENRQCTLPASDVKSCSCFEILNMAHLWLKHAKVDEEEYKQRFKRAAKKYHPDKKGGSESHMVHLRACSALLRDPKLVKIRKEYIVEMKKVLDKCSKAAPKRKMSPAECYRSEVEMLHDCETGICLSKPKQLPSDIAGDAYTEKGIMERLVVLIDDSASMKGWKLESAKAALAGIMPRIERTPTDIHFIRSRDGPTGFVSTQVAAYNDTAMAYEDIASNWQVCCTTWLWEYAHGVVSSIVSPLIEVVILTDGEDTDSVGEFNGPSGFSHMIKLFLVSGKQPRFRVYCIGNDVCMGKNKYYRDIALATGGAFMSVDHTTNATSRRSDLATFAEECNAPFQERKERASQAQSRYQTLLLDGDAQKYEWADELRPAQSNFGDEPQGNEDSESHGSEL